MRQEQRQGRSARDRQRIHGRLVSLRFRIGLSTDCKIRLLSFCGTMIERQIPAAMQYLCTIRTNDQQSTQHTPSTPRNPWAKVPPYRSILSSTQDGLTTLGNTSTKAAPPYPILSSTQDGLMTLGNTPTTASLSRPIPSSTQQMPITFANASIKALDFPQTPSSTQYLPALSLDGSAPAPGSPCPSSLAHSLPSKHSIVYDLDLLPPMKRPRSDTTIWTNDQHSRPRLLRR